MKTTQLSLCFILFSIYTNSLFYATAQEPAPVLDVDRNALRAGAEYYILPVMRGRGGGLTLASSGNFTCPLAVVQEPLEVNNGLPVTFHPVDSKKTICLSIDQNIKFSAASICVQSTVWQLDSDDGEYVIRTGGTIGYPGLGTISNWFKIEEEGDFYKLVFCPTVCDNCRPICKDVGVFLAEDGKRVLGLSLTDYAPFMVMFKKA